MTLAELLVRHNQNIQSIQTLSAKYQAYETLDGQETLLGEGSYTRKDDNVCLRSNHAGGGSSDTLFTHGDSKVVWRMRDGQTTKLGGVTKGVSAESVALGDIYQQFMISGFPSGSKRKLTLEELYNSGGDSTSLAIKTLNGRETIRVTLRYKAGDSWVRITHWHDPENNYLIVRREMVIGDTDNLLVIEMSDFQRFGESVFPGACRTHQYIKGELNRDCRVIAKDLKINQLVPPGAFVLPPVPSGTTCTDFTTMEVYPIGSDWKKNGPGKPHVVYAVDSGPKDVYTESLGNKVSDAEAPRRWNWLIFLSVGLIAMAGAVKFYRNRIPGGRK